MVTAKTRRGDVSETAVETRTRVVIRYDEGAENPVHDGEELFGVLVQDEHGGPTIHELMRDVSCAVRVDVPTSYVDRGQRPAILYLTPAKVRECYGADNTETRARARTSLLAEATGYRAWADGYSYGFVLTEERKCPTCDEWSEVEGEEGGAAEVGSVWGFTTYDENELIDWMGEHMDERGKAALANAIENWTGDFPVPARGEAA